MCEMVGIQINLYNSSTQIDKMHSASARFNNVTLFTATVLAIMCAVNFAHGYFIYNPKVDVQLSLNYPSNFMDTKLWEQAAFKYSLYADLSTLYTWNLKQLYAYIELQWVDPISNLTSRTIATDWILQIPQDKSKLQKEWTLNVTDTRMDYLVRDVNHNLRGNTIKVSLNIEYMPIVGPFFKSRLFETSYTMPEAYTNSNVK